MTQRRLRSTIKLLLGSTQHPTIPTSGQTPHQGQPSGLIRLSSIKLCIQQLIWVKFNISRKITNVTETFA
jgi:hypothetical protein